METIQTLIVCEKPDAAARVARALDDDGDPRRSETQGVPFFESRNRQETILVCSALGHLYAVDSKDKTSRRYYPVWDYEWKPKHLVDRESRRLARWVQVIGSLARKSDRYINACDYDVEGSLIGYTILRYACQGVHSRAQRMKFSTMTEKEIRTAYKTLSPQLDLGLVEAGRCRHELDWLYGINLSRLLTGSALKQNRGYSTISTGRVQGPTLKFVVEREEDIQCFTPTPFWTMDATILHNGKEYPIEYAKEKIGSAASATQIVEDCRDALLEIVNSESRNVRQAPPYPFDLSTLQAEAFRHFGYTPARSLALAERLYLDALISYPRTSSQKLAPDIGYLEILQGISARPEYRSLAMKLVNQGVLRPTQGPKEDPAHPSVYPTGELPKRILSKPEANLLDLIIRRFMATFAEASLRETNKLTLRKDPHQFFLRGNRLVKEGWIEYYKPYVSDDSQQLPDLTVGDKIAINKVEAVERFTEPPSRYNPSSLLRKMEDENIGTKATRAEIIETLYRRGYIKYTRMEATPLAIKVISVLDEHCPVIIEASFTARLEASMEKIQMVQTTRAQILAEAMEHLRPVMLTLIASEDKIGPELAEAVSSERIANISFEQPCPLCSSRLKIIRSRQSGKRFVGCTGYEKGCRFTLPLPQYGTLKITLNRCKTCGFQLIQARTRGRRPLVCCPRCYSTNRSEKLRAKPSASYPTRSTESVAATT